METIGDKTGQPRAEGTYTGTLVKVGDLCRNSGECQGGSHEYGIVAKVRQSSHPHSGSTPCLALLQRKKAHDKRSLPQGELAKLAIAMWNGGPH